jgi:glucokinase
MATGTRPKISIGLDVGGTKIAAGVVSGGTVLERLEQPTPVGGSSAVETMFEMIGSLRQRHDVVEAVGVGAAGMVEWPDGHIKWAPNNAYHDLPLRKRLEEVTGLPAVVDNDANAAAWAEARYGAGAGRRDVLVVTVGTGIGSGFILDDRLYRGSTGLGGEFGHITVAPDGPVCGCGNRGCLEAVASGTALGREGRAAAEASPTGAIATLAGDPARVTGEVVFAAAKAGDPAAIGLFDKLGGWLGIGLGSLVTLLDPEVVVIGGGMIAVGELLLTPARRALPAHTFAHDRRLLPPVVAASLGPATGLIGAADLALQPLA